MEHITLNFRQGSSDKIYQASLEPKDGGYVVNFAYGRRGATLTAGTKTQTPVSYDEARRIYDRLVAEKTAKGYTPGTDGTLSAGAAVTRRALGPRISPKCVNAIVRELAASWYQKHAPDRSRDVCDEITAANLTLVRNRSPPVLESAL